MPKSSETEQKRTAEVRRWMQSFIDTNGFPTVMDGHIGYLLSKKDITVYHRIGFSNYSLAVEANGALQSKVLDWLKANQLADLIAPFERVSVGRYISSQLPSWERSRDKLRTELEQTEKVIAGYQTLKKRYGIE